MATTDQSYDDTNIDSKEQIKDQAIMTNNTATLNFHIIYIVKNPETILEGC